MSLINVTNLTFAYEGSYDNIFENVSFQIDTDWKLGFTGRNGRGKSSTLNFIDVISRMQIEKLLIGHEPTILFVEHDSAFCENVAIKIIKL